MADRDDDSEDRELMRRIGQQDMAAYRALLDKYLVKYTRFAERMLGGHNDAKDVMQDICLKIWNNPGAWQPNARFSTWLYRVLCNACIDHKRKHKRTVYMEIPDSEDFSQNQEADLLRTEKLANVRDAMQRLPERQRAALVLCYYEELSNEEAAAAMGIPLGALQQLLFRARQNLKQSLLPEVQVEAAHG